MRSKWENSLQENIVTSWMLIWLEYNEVTNELKVQLSNNSLKSKVITVLLHNELQKIYNPVV